MSLSLRFILKIAIYFGVPCFLNAQNLDFEADVTKGCAPLTITVSLVDNTLTPDEVKYSFFEGQAFGDGNTFTYTEPGIYSIVQLIQLDASAGAAVPITREDYIEVIAPETPQFILDKCSGFTARVNVTDTLYDFYDIDFGDGSPLVRVGRNEVATHVYSDALERQVTVKGGFTDGGNASCGESSRSFIPENVIDQGSIDRAEVLTNGDIQLNYTISESVVYILQESIERGAFVDVDTLDAGQNTLALQGRNTRDELSCFRIKSFDACAGTTIISDEICVSDLRLTDARGTNQVEWRPFLLSPLFDQFNIYIDGVLSETILNNRITAYNHEDVLCNVDYCYQLEAVYSNGASALSSEQCITASSATDPPVAEILNVTVEGDSVVLTYELPADLGNIRTVDIQRAENGSAFTSLPDIDTTSDTYNDTVVNVNAASYCYKIITQDTCNNFSPESVTVCTVLLSGQKSDEGNELNWTPFQGFPFGFSYTLEILDEQGNIIDSIENLARNTQSFIDINSDDESIIRQYRIKVVADHDASLVSFSNIAVIIDELELLAPEAFTPNDDGLNDTFFLRGQLITNYKLQIFSRWGELIFTSDDIEEGWDGTFNGNEVPVGPYSYVVKAGDVFGNEKEQKGLFLLIR
ncbi:MAG: gliding motility-associated C-terminal domain-containing protein [Bacteroidota bacterium]